MAQFRTIEARDNTELFQMRFPLLLAGTSIRARLTTMDPTTTAWLILILGYLLPLAHVALSRRGGPGRRRDRGGPDSG
jgi:hypothetical protein